MQDKTTPVPQADLEDQECPRCHNRIPVYRDYISWCDACEWNLQPGAHDRPSNVFESLYASMGEKFSKRLYEELGAGSLSNKLTPSKVGAFVVALVVHALTIVVAITGAMLLVTASNNCVAILAGSWLLLAAWVLRPRLHKLDRDEVVSREQCPTLYKVADDVAHALNVSSVDVILVNETFNASFAQIGLRRKRVLCIGLPLLSVLGPRELVALLGHEIAHSVNGDPNRGFFTGSAMSSLVRWYDILHPDQLVDDSSGHGCLTVPGNLILLALSTMVLFWLQILAILSWRDSQRAEYLADSLAARIGDTDAMLSMLEKLQLADTFHVTLQRVALNWSRQDLFAEVRQSAIHVPARELERIRRVEQKENSRLDTSHPPTALRISLLKAHPVAEAQVMITQSQYDQIERELTAARARVQEKLLNAYGKSLYY